MASIIPLFLRAPAIRHQGDDEISNRRDPRIKKRIGEDDGADDQCQGEAGVGSGADCGGQYEWRANQQSDGARHIVKPGRDRSEFPRRIYRNGNAHPQDRADGERGQQVLFF